MTFLLIFTIVSLGVVAEKDCSAPAHRRDLDLEIGFLEFWEDLPSRHRAIDCENWFRVRLAFKWQNGNWIPYKHDFDTSESVRSAHAFFSGQRSWTAVMNGRKIRQLSSAGVPRYKRRADIGIQKILGDVHPGVFADDMAQVLSWRSPHTRLLVLVSGPFWGDPEGWRRETGAKAPPPRVVSLMREHMPLRKPEAGDNLMTAPQVPYSQEELEVFEVYRCPDGRSLMGVKFREGSRAYREDYLADLSVHWTAFGAAREPRYLGSEMTVLDIEDFDGDGKSEFVFWVNAYNCNGYMIVWDDFQQCSSFTWSYH